MHVSIRSISPNSDFLFVSVLNRSWIVSTFKNWSWAVHIVKDDLDVSAFPLVIVSCIQQIRGVWWTELEARNPYTLEGPITAVQNPPIQISSCCIFKEQSSQPASQWLTILIFNWNEGVHIKLIAGEELILERTKSSWECVSKLHDHVLLLIRNRREFCHTFTDARIAQMMSTRAGIYKCDWCCSW